MAKSTKDNLNADKASNPVVKSTNPALAKAATPWARASDEPASGGKRLYKRVPGWLEEEEALAEHPAQTHAMDAAQSEGVVLAQAGAGLPESMATSTGGTAGAATGSAASGAATGAGAGAGAGTAAGASTGAVAGTVASAAVGAVAVPLASTMALVVGGVAVAVGAAGGSKDSTPTDPTAPDAPTDTVAPNAPTLALGTGVSGGATSAEATAAGGVVTVAAESGASVVVTFTNGSNSVSKTVTGNGSTPVAVTLTGADLTTLGDGTIGVSATATDAAGNASSAGTTSFVLDTGSPNAPTLALGTGVSGGATSAEATAAGGVVTVVAESGASVVVTFTNGSNSVSKTVTGNGSTPVAVTLTGADLTTLGDGTIGVSATATDAAGNASSAGTSSFVLDTAIATPVLALGTGVDNGATRAEATAAGGVVTVAAESGASVVVTFTNGSNSVSKTVTGNGSTPVAVTLTGADLTTLGDGTIGVSATATDAAGNASSAGTTSFTLTSTVFLADIAAGTGGFVVNGQAASDYSAYSVSVAGDVNGDGLGDFIVGAYKNDGTASDAGRSYVVFGKTGHTAIDLSAVAGGTGGFAINGQSANDYSAYSVSAAGDVNGDGLGDFIVGAYKNDGTASDAGRSYVVFGKTVHTAIDLSAVAGGTGGFAINGQSANDYSAYSVSPAGDVNGDGLADVIVGAYGNSTSTGRSYVVFGKLDTSAISLSSLGTGGFQINGISTNDWSGYSVSSAGDVNGDGLADLLIGSHQSDPSSGSDAGRSYVLFGKTSATAVNLSALTATTTQGFVINGVTTSDNSGWSVSSAGDVNGDGLADLIVGAPKVDVGTNTDAGASYIVFGKTSGAAVDLSAVAAGTGGFAINGVTTSDNSGSVVSSAGDINGDGLGDVIVNAANTGKAWVVYGKTSGTATDLTAVEAGVGGFVISGQTTDGAAWAVSAAGDLNGDGYADLLVGAPNASVGGNAGVGRTYVLYGGPQFAGTPVVTGTGTAAAEWVAGTDGADTLSGGGGVDRFSAGDGNDTVILTADDVANLGNVTVGGPKAFVDGGGDFDTLRLNGANLDLTTIRHAGGMTGATGESLSRINRIERIDMATDTAANTLTLSATDVNDMAGMNLIRTGSVSADGKTWSNVSGTALASTTRYHQLVVDGGSVDALNLASGAGGWYRSGRVSDGSQTYWVYQNDTTRSQVMVKDAVLVTNNDFLAPSVSLTAVFNGAGGFVIQGQTTGGHFGASVSSAGDVNGDGLMDLIVGSYTADYSATDAGRSYVVFGRTGTAAINLATMVTTNGNMTDGFVINGQAATDRSGYSVSSAGDVNGDGLADLIVGAYSSDPGAGLSAGRSYVVFGKSDGAPIDLSSVDAGTGGFVINGQSAGDLSGVSVSSAGDVNGDGLADLIVGAESNGAGRSYVVFGKTSVAAIDLSAIAGGTGGFVITGQSAGDSFGGAVSAAGDVNGDGLADLIVGARGNDANGSDTGRGYVVFGKTDTTAINLGSVVASDGSMAGGFVIGGLIDNFTYLGYSVSAAGDVNGDGLGDLVIGADNKRGSFVVFGKTDSARVDLAPLMTGSSSGAGFYIAPNSTDNANAKYGVTSLGDVNGDGLADLLVSASYDNAANLAYVVYGSAANTPIQLSRVALGNGGFVITGGATNTLRWTVSSAGDVNGDGYADLLIGTPYDNPSTSTGLAYVVYGDPRFSNSVIALGTGTSANELVVGTSGADTLTGGGGVDRFSAGAGNDTIVLTASDVTNLANITPASVKARVDGGTGIDTLQLSGGANLDLTQISNVGRMTGDTGEALSRINSIERIDMATDTGSNTLKLTARDLMDMSGFNPFEATGRHQLLVKGQGQGQEVDTVDLADGAGTWTRGTDVILNSVTYQVWNHNTTLATLYLDTDISVF